MFSALHDTYFSLSMHFRMLSAISFNLDHSKNFSSGNGLNHQPLTKQQNFRLVEIDDKSSTVNIA